MASEPKTTSQTPAELMRFAIMQPMNSPHVAQGMKNGRTQSASETRIWIGP